MFEGLVTVPKSVSEDYKHGVFLSNYSFKLSLVVCVHM